HDTTVAALLSTFGDEMEVIRGGLPKYTASVVVELWTLQDEGPAVRPLISGCSWSKQPIILPGVRKSQPAVHADRHQKGMRETGEK
ncbi:hypothetical protein GCK32_021302, partial [Trichostrongylus colubriformis]